MKTEFSIIAEDIIENSEFKKLANENHHGLSRYEHSLRVAKSTYKITKKLGLDYVSATRAALLHDFFVDEECLNVKGFKKGKIHPYLAVRNAKQNFTLNSTEEDAIVTHMFPLTTKLPRTKEALVLNLADTGVALYECSRFKLKVALGVWVLFLLNIITLKLN